MTKIAKDLATVRRMRRNIKNYVFTIQGRIIKYLFFYENGDRSYETTRALSELAEISS